ncbi:unnamed protein product [Zymoseptoria tritici ST99CH_1E4]|uniref:Uncharacterized protein n=2 Tax=Zymoseptoria tritici TaxID=1047171 RepID=F9XCM3_ZYMTI|nr:uncharacterized protein MYCGRDRAFT_93284 [Zymoseptoria tritici IPO323]EGP87202.1 hypothetical protein MYCGRDRAFT_93284 [Zymoseptoria tritici IPO323]SMR52840.1 unnamed protein product [Zymoseptoria tritici ST99CH_1E4]
MCVIEEKIYQHSNGRQEIQIHERRCHNASGSGLCQHVERKAAGPVQISEIRPSSSTSRPSSVEIVTEGRDGKQRRYQEVRRRSAKRSSTTSSKNPRMDSPTSPSSRRHRRSRPEAPEPPPTRSEDASVQQQYEDVERVLAADGTAIYNQPPSLYIPRAIGENERLSSARRSSFSSVSAEVDASEEPRRSALRDDRPPNLIIDTGASMTDTSSSVRTSAPGLSNLPRFSQSRHDSANEIPIRTVRGKQPVRADSTADDDEQLYRRSRDEDERQADVERERLATSERRRRRAIDDDQAQKERSRLADSARRQQEAVAEDQAEKERIRLFASLKRQQQAIDEDQAEKERNRLAASQRRHEQAQDDEQARKLRDHMAAGESRQRVRAAREAEAAALKRAEAHEQEERRRIAGEEARRMRHRDHAASALERPEVDAATQRRMDHEYDHLLFERDVAESIRRSAEDARYEAQSSVLRPPVISARVYTPSQLSEVSSPVTWPPAVHNYTPISTSNSSAGPSTLRQKGEAVIRWEQGRGQTERQNATTGERQRRKQRENESIDAAMEEMDARMNAGFGRSQSVREREREHRSERTQYYR